MDIIERYPDGRHRVRFSAVPPERVGHDMRELLGLWAERRDRERVHPLIAAVAVNLDFLCIHPFRDGNGRVSRLLLLLLLQCYHLGYEVGRYISLERLIERNRERYYETLEASRTGQRRGEKSEAVVRAIQEQPGAFRVADIQKLAPAAGPDLVRHVLKQLRMQGRVKCLGRGQQAQWRRVGEWN